MDPRRGTGYGPSTSSQWSLDDRTAPASAFYSPVLGQNPRAIHRDDTMFMSQGVHNASNGPSAPHNQHHTSPSAQLYPTHIQAYGPPPPQRAPLQNIQEPYQATQAPYQNVFNYQRTQTLPSPNTGIHARPKTAPNRGYPPQSQGGFQRVGDQGGLPSRNQTTFYSQNGHAIPFAPNGQPPNGPSSQPMYPSPHPHPNEWARDAHAVTNSPQQLDSATPLPHPSNYRPNPYLQRPRQGSLPPMHRLHDAHPQSQSFTLQDGHIPEQQVPPQDLLLSQSPQTQVASNPYTQPQGFHYLEAPTSAPSGPNPYLQPRRHESLQASSSRQQHSAPNPYLGRGQSLTATHRPGKPIDSGPSALHTSFQRPPDALVPGIPPPLPPLPPTQGPSSEEEEEFSRALALSHNEEAERKRQQDELLKQEEDDLARALAESMLSTGTELYGSGSNPFFIEPDGAASSSKYTLDSPEVPTSMRSPVVSSPDRASNAQVGYSRETLGALGDLDGTKITGFDELASRSPVEGAGISRDGKASRSASRQPSLPRKLTNGVESKLPTHVPNPVPVPSPESAGSLLPVEFGDHSSSTSSQGNSRSYPEAERPGSPSELAYCKDETPLPSPRAAPIASAAAPSPSLPAAQTLPVTPFMSASPTSTSPTAAVTTQNHNQVPVAQDEPPPPEYSPPCQPLPPANLQRNSQGSFASRVPSIITTQSPPQPSRPLSENSHSPLSSTHSIPIDNVTPSGVPLARVASNVGQAEENARAAIGANQFIDTDLLMGVSMSFESPIMTDKLKPMETAIPNVVSLPYGRCPPLHIQAPSWKHMLKLLARMSSTRFEPTVQAQAITKSALKLRTVIQFVKPLDNYPHWRTLLWFKIEYPVPPDLPDASRWTTNNPNVLPFAFTLNTLPRILQNATDGPVSKTYTIPATDTLPYPTLPISCPNLAIYLQAALDFSRSQKEDNTGFKKLGKMINTCYPSKGDDVGLEGPDRGGGVGGLFKKVMGRKDKKAKGKSNNETYEFITPFVPDEWG